MSDSLWLLYKKERPGANRSHHFVKEWLWGNGSHRSLEKSDCEQIALDFFKKEGCQWFACDSSKLLSKDSDLLKKNMFFYVFYSFSLHFLLFISWRERIAPVAFDKRATMSESLQSLFTKERPWAIALFHKRINLLLIKNEWFARKTDEWIPNPAVSKAWQRNFWATGSVLLQR